MLKLSQCIPVDMPGSLIHKQNLPVFSLLSVLQSSLWNWNSNSYCIELHLCNCSNSGFQPWFTSRHNAASSAKDGHTLFFSLRGIDCLQGGGPSKETVKPLAWSPVFPGTAAMSPGVICCLSASRCTAKDINKWWASGSGWQSAKHLRRMWLWLRSTTLLA